MGTAYALMNYCSLQLQGALFVQFSIVTGREKHQKIIMQLLIAT
jgi:hypothetical protein